MAFLPKTFEDIVAHVFGLFPTCYKKKRVDVNELDGVCITRFVCSYHCFRINCVATTTQSFALELRGTKNGWTVRV